MPKYTHQKHPYRAHAIQWDGKNTEEVIEVLTSAGADVQPHMECLMLRYKDRVNLNIDTMKITDWIVRGENGMVKCYTDKVFNEKYEEINNAK